MTWYLKALAPFFAVLVGWVWLENAWLAILGYHIQIIFWSLICNCKEDYNLGRVRGSWSLILPVLFTGVGAYYLLPFITKINLSHWLDQYGLRNWSFILMIFYFGLIHPFLEQRHWRPLCQDSQKGHFFFAGYHALVLISLMNWSWVIVSVVVLVVASLFWSWLYQREKGGLSGVLSHIFADFGMIIAFWFLVK